jgi:rubredoxin
VLPAAKGREMHQVAAGHRFDRLPSLAPCRKPAHKYERVESFLAQQMRHTGARGFALSSTVEVDVLVFRKFLGGLGQAIWLKSN